MTKQLTDKRKFEPKQLTEDQAIKQVLKTVSRARSGDAPFALVLGAGFSFGLVPTVRELITTNLPLWWRADADLSVYRTLLKNSTAQQRQSAAKEFWREFQDSNPRLDLQLGDSGLPAANNFATAYQAVFSPDSDSIVSAPADARAFQRTMMSLDRNRLNAAHFFLASILGVQPTRTRESELFRASSAFCRLIITTNFDPFLQIALQSVNRLYFMSDTPDLGVSDEILDDNSDAIHLVYLHGSVHRRAQATTEDQIRTIKERNANVLAPVLKRKGVIVLGYSGWDDAIVEALSRCADFDHRLYWFGRSAEPVSAGTVGPRFEEVMVKPSAYYVLTSGAARVMQMLHSGMVKKLPRLLSNPIGQLREMLEALDLSDLSATNARQENTMLADAAASANAGDADAERSSPFELARTKAIELLAKAEHTWDSAEPGHSSFEQSAGERLRQSMRLAFNIENWPEVIELCDRFLEHDPNLAERIMALDLRAQARSQVRDSEGALQDWNSAVALAEQSPVEQFAVRLRRAVELTSMGRYEAALMDTSTIVQAEVVSLDLKAQALIQRASILGRLSQTDRQIEDLSAVAHMSSLPVERVSEALLHRGDAYARSGVRDKAVLDYTLLTSLPGAPEEDVRRAAIASGFLISDSLRPLDSDTNRSSQDSDL